MTHTPFYSDRVKIRMPTIVTTCRCPDCFGFLKPSHYSACASCDGERLRLSCVDPRETPLDDRVD